MKNEYFVNRYFEETLEEYINCEKSKVPHQESFNYYVLLMLIDLFGDLDLINPFITQNVKALIDNMAKYGYSKNDILVFFDSFEKFNEISEVNNKSKNSYFIKIQKELIDMYFQKKQCVNIENNKKFYNLLFTPNNGNLNKVQHNRLMCDDEFEIDDYFKKRLYEFENPVKVKPVVEFVETEAIEENEKGEETHFTLASARGNVNILIILLTTAVVGLALAIINLVVG